ncbi:MAG: ATP-dependent DNA helicase RecG [Streptococcaceae bacterium]|jgi:ATP-dependent DNA helicase RecG|nr:ATP-dependent DNA helicase RecG [Streptococcaceae bacterium]
MNLTDDIQYLKGVGPKSIELYHKLDIFTVEDLLLYFPFRFEDFAGRQALELMDSEIATVKGIVATQPNLGYFGARKSRLAFKIKQGEVAIGVTFFNQPYLKDKVVVGEEVGVYGKWDSKKVQMTGLKLISGEAQAGEDGLMPIYHLTEGLKQTALVKLIRQVMTPETLAQLLENLPAEFLQKYRLMDRQNAVRAMHFPENDEEHKQALRRVKFEELFFFQLKLQALKNKEKSGREGLRIAFEQSDLDAKIAELPFALTGAQSKALGEILADMTSPYHMNRLLQGDVGSGKTVVAELAMYTAALANFQSALMVPTEILARQHFANLTATFPELNIGLLVSGLKASERREILADLASGHLHMVVGTHALIQEGVDFYNLGLVITDEQHRFGVNQRKILREKGQNPDVLMMTATPIPRTLAITAFGDMDVSIIDELPAGRQPITTRWVKHSQMASVTDWLKSELSSGAQAYFVSPLIEESEALDLKNAEALFAELTETFSQNKVGLLHGKMKNDEKDAIMTAFKVHETDVLVSTTVIEVGVDVPNATVMVIMDADRFGLSQLHQLRGRVGRGTKKSYCILVANPKTDSGKHRMQIMCETQNGFVLAEEDLKMRGSGEIFGTRQSGLPEFLVADLVNDYNILEVARTEAVRVFSEPERYRELIAEVGQMDESFD